MSTEKIERNGNRTQTESGKLNDVFCPLFSVLAESLEHITSRSLRKCVGERDSVELLQCDGDSLEQQ